MNEKTNIAELIRNYGKSTDRYYLCITGEMHKVIVSLQEDFPVMVCNVGDDQHTRGLTSWGGVYSNRPDCECILYPAEDQRDWQAWAAERQAEIVSQLHPGQKVLVRDGGSDEWKLTVYSHYTEGNLHPYSCCDDVYKYCIPYRWHEHLVGTRHSADSECSPSECSPSETCRGGLYPGMLVLVRDELTSDVDPWKVTLYSHCCRDIDGEEDYVHMCCDNKYRYCIPYEGNERYVGTTDNPDGL